MNTPIPDRSLWRRVQERLAASRFLTFSLLIHTIIVIVGGSAVLFHHPNEAPDFAGDPISPGELLDPPIVDKEAAMPDVQPQVNLRPASASTEARLPLSVLAVSNPAGRVPLSVELRLPTGVHDTPAISPKAGHYQFPASMIGRDPARRGAMGRAMGQTPQAEYAVLRGLRWLKEHQNADGSWSDEHRPAMTGFAVLCFLGHGELPQMPEFGPTVKRGLDWLLAKGSEFQGRMSLTRDGWGGGNAGVYEHAIATYAMGEYYTMTHDERFVGLLAQAVGYIVQGQAPDGGWQYAFSKGPDSDTSVSGWQIQALKAAHLTGLALPGVDEVLDKAMLNLKRVQAEDGSFGYRKAGDRDYSLDGAGVLCTYFWKQDKDRSVREGIQHLLRQTDNRHPVKYQDDRADLYAWYYHTQACLMYGGPAWEKWNRLFQRELIAAQSPDGSWPACPGKSPGGELQRKTDGAGPCYRTALCTLMLEVFYRTMPVTKG